MTERMIGTSTITAIPASTEIARLMIRFITGWNTREPRMRKGCHFDPIETFAAKCLLVLGAQLSTIPILRYGTHKIHDLTKVLILHYSS